MAGLVMIVAGRGDGIGLAEDVVGVGCTGEPVHPTDHTRSRQANAPVRTLTAR